MPEPIPVKIDYHQKSRILEVAFDDKSVFNFSTEFLRVFSPSAEVRGHAPGEEKLQLNKENVCINDIEPVGNYAIKLVFSDKHDSGLYSWELLYEYGQQQEQMWQSYLKKVDNHRNSEKGI